MPASPVIHGVRVRQLSALRDARGAFAELHRADWEPGLDLVQWNLMTSGPGVLRGLHVHPRHRDLLLPIAGRLLLGLKDLRAGSPTELAEQALELDADEPVAVVIPNGVAHGLFSRTATRVLVGVDAAYDPADELGCRWDDPDVGLFREVEAPLLSERDTAAPSLADLRRELSRLGSGAT